MLGKELNQKVARHIRETQGVELTPDQVEDTRQSAYAKIRAGMKARGMDAPEDDEGLFHLIGKALKFKEDDPIRLVCPRCRASSVIERQPYDPPRAACAHILCPRCVGSDYSDVAYYDAAGDEIMGPAGTDESEIADFAAMSDAEIDMELERHGIDLGAESEAVNRAMGRFRKAMNWRRIMDGYGRAASEALGG